ncbi:MAG TPA: carbohydrate ABC transporter permease [Epulopiscium sp.]|nr:carbohydrate ABC transporter permease [Candidatus Epulonipiscium sp.]
MIFKKLKINKKHIGINQRRSKTGDGIVALIIILLGLFMAFPLYYTFIQSIKPPEELFQFPPKLYVIRPTLDSYRDLFQIMSNMWVPFSRYLFNSLFIAILGTGFHVLLASMAAYPLAKHKFPGKDFIFAVILLGLMFVGQVTFLPSFVIISKLGMLNTYWAYLLPSIGTSLGLFLMKQFIEQIPDALIEASRIDGANEWRTFFQIIVPNVKPAILTVIIFQFVNIWNGLSSELVYAEQLKVVKVALEQISLSSNFARMGAAMAGSVLLMLPPIILFVLLQKNVVDTMAFAGIKE